MHDHRLGAAWRPACTALLVVAYAAGVYWSNRHAPGLALLLAVAPLAWLAARHAAGHPGLALTQRLLRTVPLLAGGLLLALAWPLLQAHVTAIYLAQHLIAHTLLAGLFGRSLLPGRVALCTEMAAWVGLDVAQPRLHAYTRAVTWLWTVFFVGMALASLAVYVLLPAASWVFFSAVVGPLVTIALFPAEDLVRRIVLPPQHRVGLLGTWRAIRDKLVNLELAPATGHPDGA